MLPTSERVADLFVPGLPLEAVLTTAELSQRASRPRDFAKENQELRRLAQILAAEPKAMLQELVESALRLCRSHSAGITVEDIDEGKKIFRWKATAGEMARFVGGTMPREFSPCTETVHRNTPVLMTEPVLHYPYISGLGIPIREVLLVPFKQSGHAIGTIWVVAHTEARKFDEEDARVLESLSEFVGAAVGTLRTIADLERSGASLAEMATQMETALAAGNIATWHWEVEANRVFVDATMAELFGVSSADANGGPIETYTKSIHPEDRLKVESLIQQSLKPGGTYAAEYRLIGPNGQRWVMARGSVAKDEHAGLTRLRGVLVDITDRKVANQALRAARDEAIAAKLEITRVRDEVIIASAAKDRFLAALSHELRTPLNPALLLASEGERNPAISDEMRQDFGSIRKHIELEVHLIDDILDLTRVGQGKLAVNLEPTSVHRIIREALTILRAEISAKRLALAVQLTAQRHLVAGDAVRLQQVFWNLLRNAVKFTPEGGQIGIESVVTADSCLEVSISDTGIGLTDEETETIFHAFAQGRHAGVGEHSKFGGLGLGLTISRSLVALHGGDLRASSRGKDLGATFVVRFPLLATAPANSDEASQELAPPNFRGDSTRKLRVLLIEDHAGSRDALALLLDRRGLLVAAAENCADALQLAEENVFDLIISDIGLPDGDGYELMTMLRARHDLRGFALTGYGMEEDRARSAAAGFMCHLTKPVSVSSLDSALQQFSTNSKSPAKS